MGIMSILNIFRDIKKEYSIDVCIKVPMVKADMIVNIIMH